MAKNLSRRSSGASALDHLQELPRLAPGKRAARGDLDRVTFLRLAVLVMREKLRRTADELAVLLVTHQPLDFDGDGLLHLRADDATREGARADRLDLRLGRRGSRRRCHGSRLLALFSAHYLFTPALLICASRAMVFNRAMFFRTLPNWSGFTAWPVARCKRSANCSLRSFRSSSLSAPESIVRSFSATLLG